MTSLNPLSNAGVIGASEFAAPSSKNATCIVDFVEGSTPLGGIRPLAWFRKQSQAHAKTPGLSGVFVFDARPCQNVRLRAALHFAPRKDNIARCGPTSFD